MKEPFTFYHLYVGCDVQTPDGFGKNLGLYYSPEINDFNGVNVLYPEGKVYVLNFNQVKPILRKISDITEEERIECMDLRSWHTDTRIRIRQTDAMKTVFLLSKHFDLFDLIMHGLAIERGLIIYSDNV